MFLNQIEINLLLSLFTKKGTIFAGLFNKIYFMRNTLFSVLLLFVSVATAQETLLLGEQQEHEVYFEARTDGIEKVNIYSSKYRKKGNYKDSSLVGFEIYNKKGEMIGKTNYSGSGSKATYSQFSYDYQDGRMTAFHFIQTSPAGNFGRQGEFEYNSDGLLIYQSHSMANIKYAYYTDGRKKTKSYFYNNKGASDSEPWIHYYLYDDSLNLIHVDTDKESKKQTSFYNDKNELIRHDYYPGFAYSTYEYDAKGNCTKQVDFELGKKDWDSTVFVYAYNNEGKITTSGTLNKKGKSIAINILRKHRLWETFLVNKLNFLPTW